MDKTDHALRLQSLPEFPRLGPAGRATRFRFILPPQPETGNSAGLPKERAL